MNCIDCSYSLLKDGHSKCTYEEGECIKISVLEKKMQNLKKIYRAKKLAIQNRNSRIKELEKDYDEAQELLDKQIEATLKLYKKNLELKEHHKSTCESLTNTHRHIREQLNEAKELLRFWVNDFYDSFSNSIKYEERCKALREAEQFLKEV